MKSRALVIAALTIVVFIGAIWAAHRGPVPMPVIPKAHGHCVLPPNVMLREHMMLLRRVREQIVRDDSGNRKDRITNCVSCHVQRNAAGQAIPVNAKGQFCQVCHAYVGVHLDCFACHAAKPEKAFPVGFFSGKGKHLQASFRIPKILTDSKNVSHSGGHHD